MSERLYEEIRKIQTEIIHHSNDFLQNEEQTIITLINPILREVGWKTGNPREVKRQYSVEGGRVDIALLRNGEPVVFVEAKALNTRLDAKLKQISDYCSHYGVPTALLTDGAEWRIYRPLLTTLPFGQRQILRIQLGESETEARNAAKQLALLAPEELEQLEEISWPILIDNYWNAFGKNDSDLLKKLIKPLRQSFANYLKKRTVEVPPEAVRSFLRDKLELQTPPAPPIPQPEPEPTPPDTGRAVILDGERIALQYANEILIQTAEWLIKRGHLHRKDCPILSSKWATERFFIHDVARHPNGRDFYSPKKLSNGLYLAASHSQRGIIRIARSLLERYDYPPDTLQLIGFDD